MSNEPATKEPARRLKSNFAEYAENTSIHGIKYFGGTQRSWCEQIYWIIILSVCIICLGLFNCDILAKWLQNEVIFLEDNDMTPVYRIPFPAVTICPQIKIKTSEFTIKSFVQGENLTASLNSTENDNDMKIILAHLICGKYWKNVKYDWNQQVLNTSHIDLLYEISPSFDYLFSEVTMPNSCSPRFSTTPKQETFSSILTNEGVCFTFNLPQDVLRFERLQTDYVYYNLSENIRGWNLKTGYQIHNAFPRKACGAGEQSGLNILLKSPKVDLGKICHHSELGYKVILHSPVTYPSTLGKYIPVYHDTMVKIEIEPIRITSSDTLRNFSPAQRKCYYNNERKLKYYRFYNRINCQLECFANFTLEFFNCTHFAFPRSAGESICGFQNINHHNRIAGLDALREYLNEYPEVGKSSKNRDFNQNMSLFTCGCLPDCNSIEYDYKIITGSYEYDGKHRRMESEPVDSNLQSNRPAQVQIYWSSSHFISKTRTQLYTVSELVSNFGGLLGLFMGASILSLFEMFYFCVLRRLMDVIRLNY